jgi:CRP-like cAMP-binding protein
MKIDRSTGHILDTLAEAPFFRCLNQRQLEMLASCALGSSFSAGEEIFTEGEPANRFYLILNGSVALESYEPGRAPIHIQMLGAGDVLGWSWLLAPFVWHFGARAAGPTEVIFFDGPRLRELCDDHPYLGYELVKRVAGVMVQRLQATRMQLVMASDLALRSQMIALKAVSGKRRVVSCKVSAIKKLPINRRVKIHSVKN